MGTAPGGIAYGNLNTVSTIALIGNTVSFTLTPAETPVFFFYVAVGTVVSLLAAYYIA